MVKREDRKKYLKSLEGLNEFDRLLANLNSNELSIRLMEIAYRAHLKQRPDLHEGVKTILVGTSQQNRGLIEFAQKVSNEVGSVELAFLRGQQQE